MFRSIRNLLRLARYYFAFRRSKRSPRLFDAYRNRPSSSPDSNRPLPGAPQSLSSELKKVTFYHTNERADTKATNSARTRRARNKTRVLQMSSTHLLTCQVVSILQGSGWKPRVIAENQITVVWPIETDLDSPEEPEALSMEIQVGCDSGFKFRRLTGPVGLFRSRVQEILLLIDKHRGW